MSVILPRRFHAILTQADVSSPLCTTLPIVKFLKPVLTAHHFEISVCAIAVVRAVMNAVIENLPETTDLRLLVQYILYLLLC